MRLFLTRGRGEEDSHDSDGKAQRLLPAGGQQRDADLQAVRIRRRLPHHIPLHEEDGLV